uniref:Uncharacterized protein n=1 Tax=Arundo donax TaxID=35708 RepID=A0A0A8ZWZ9_ARUDO
MWFLQATFGRSYSVSQVPNCT